MVDKFLKPYECCTGRDFPLSGTYRAGIYLLMERFAGDELPLSFQPIRSWLFVRLSGYENTLLGYRSRQYRLVKGYPDTMDTIMFGRGGILL